MAGDGACREAHRWVRTKPEMLVAAVTHSSHVRISMTPRAAALQAPLSMGTSRQEGGLPFPSPGDLPDLGIGPGSPAAGRFFTV